MKTMTIAAALLTTVFAFAVTGCASHQVIKTTDGKSIITTGKVRADEDTGLVSYTDSETGKTMLINRDQISSITPMD